MNHGITREEGLLSESSVEQCSGAEEETRPNTAETATRPNGGGRNWLSRLLWGDPPEPRRGTREAKSWIVAYFFTGGPPVAHEIRDMSSTGLYVLTQERWYPGTVVRMTVTDRRDPNADHSLTLNGRVVRWGDDGVGLEFVLQDKKSVEPCMLGTLDTGLVQISKRQIEQFLARIQKS